MGTFLLIVFGALPSSEPADTAQGTASFHAEASPAPRTRSSNIVGSSNGWRYVFHQGRWWYWHPSERWSYFDGARWIGLDSLNQPIGDRRDAAELANQLKAALGPQELRFRFGELPVARSRAGSFDTGNAAPVAGRNFAGAFELGGESPALPSPTEPRLRAVNPYGPDGPYGAYGSTNPLRGGLHIGAGGNYGYGLGAQRPALGYGQPSYRLFRQPQ
ncbi:MAG TPA: hypothetical protein VHC22_20365 [Pirellulales bacterium]|nr:hypothetical protein [Pirellulales bacterium]